MFLSEVSRLKPYHDISRADLLRSYLGLPDSLDDQDAIFFRIYQQSHRFHSMLLGLIIFYECVMLLGSGEINHFGPGENRQSRPDENRQSRVASPQTILFTRPAVGQPVSQ